MPLPMLNKEQKEPLEGVKNIIAIAAGKGGVGKSSVTVNLALALKELGYKVGVLDADIYGPSIRRMLPEDTMPIQNGSFFTPAVSQGIKMISMSFFRKENEAAAVRAPIANGLITQFLKNVNWGELDYLLIDFPPGTGDIQLTLAQQANLSGAIMVATPQEVALMDVRKAMNLFDQVKIPIVGVIENMSYFTHPETKQPLYLFGKGGGERLAREGGVTFLGMIPIDPEISLSCDSGKPLFKLGKEQPSVQVFTKLAEHLVEQVSKIKSLVIEKLVQEGPYQLSIHWTDGDITKLRYCDLQKVCPCANCNDENTGERLIDQRSIKEDVSASKIEMVGRYALRFQFTSGCTTGIFPFDMLRETARRNV